MFTTARKIEQQDLGSFLVEKIGGRASWLFDNVIFNITQKLCPSYSGGQWSAYELDNGAFVYVPELKNGFIMESPNGFSDGFSRESGGIALTMFALNYLCNLEDFENVTEQYYLLWDCIEKHKEAAKIWQFID